MTCLFILTTLTFKWRLVFFVNNVWIFSRELQPFFDISTHLLLSLCGGRWHRLTEAWRTVSASVEQESGERHVPCGGAAGHWSWGPDEDGVAVRQRGVDAGLAGGKVISGVCPLGQTLSDTVTGDPGKMARGPSSGPKAVSSPIRSPSRPVPQEPSFIPIAMTGGPAEILRVCDVRITWKDGDRFIHDRLARGNGGNKISKPSVLISCHLARMNLSARLNVYSQRSLTISTLWGGNNGMRVLTPPQVSIRTNRNCIEISCVCPFFFLRWRYIFERKEVKLGCCFLFCCCCEVKRTQSYGDDALLFTTSKILCWM